VLSSINPASGAPYTEVVLQGSGFGARPGIVTFNGAPGLILSWSSTRIEVRAPDGLAGSGPVIVNGRSNGLEFQFTPTILALIPPIAKPDWTVAVLGENFGSKPGKLTLDGAAVATSVWTNSLLVFKVPASAVTGPVAVANSVGVSTSVALTVTGGGSQPLTITAAAVPAANANGWNNTPVTVTFQCNGGTAPVQCPASQTISSQGASQVVAGTATDAAGHTATASVTLNIDETAPTIAAVVSPAPNANGWNNTLPVTVTFTCSDSLSGIDTCPAAQTIGTAGAGQTVIGIAKDKAGNSATASVNVNVGITAPSIVASVAPAPNVNGWNNSAVTVSFACVAGSAPIVSCTPPQEVNTMGQNQAVVGTAVDAAGNTATATAHVNIDETPPTITATPSPSPNNAGWNNTAVTVSFVCSDALSGIAVCPQPVMESASGANEMLSGTTQDLAGNTALAQVQVNVELVPPTITASVSPQPNQAGWSNSPVTVTFNCTPSTSPIASCSPPAAFSNEVFGQSVVGTVTDVAGNTATALTTVNLDLTPPVLTVLSPNDGATIALSSASIGVTGTASDNVSGLASVTCNGVAATISGTTFTCTVNLVQGSNSIAVLATDIAGNTANVTRTVTYSPAPQVTITAPQNLSVTNITPVTLNGTVSDPTATLIVNGIAIPQGSGSFSTPVPLVEGLNVLSVVATNPAGISSTATVQITLDTMPPHLTIDSPVNGTTTIASSVTVSGLANDVVVGTVNSQDLRVTVNGLPTQVANRSYSVSNVPLALGPNTIQATGVDAAGNSTTVSSVVTRALATNPPQPAIGAAVMNEWLSAISGDGQSAVVNNPLPNPIVVSLTDQNNQPVVNQMVVFKVIGNNGLVSNNASDPSAAAVVNTDGNGQAQVSWTLGQRAAPTCCRSRHRSQFPH